MKRSALILIILIAFTSLQAEKKKFISEGSRMPELSIEDQHGKIGVLNQDVKFVVFIADMDAADISHPFFEAKGQSFLDANGIYYIADIHRMPSIISKLFAIPKMQDYNYRLFLIRDDQRGQMFPSEEGKVTVIRVNESFLAESIQIVESKKELENALKQKD